MGPPELNMTKDLPIRSFSFTLRRDALSADTARNNTPSRRIEETHRVNSTIAGRRRVVRFGAKICNELTSIPGGIPGK